MTATARIDEQAALDHEDAALHWRRIITLRKAETEAIDRVGRLRSEYAVAIKDHRKARAELDAALDAEMRPAPLFDRAEPTGGRTPPGAEAPARCTYETFPGGRPCTRHAGHDGPCEFDAPKSEAPKRRKGKAAVCGVGVGGTTCTRPAGHDGFHSFPAAPAKPAPGKLRSVEGCRCGPDCPASCPCGCHPLPHLPTPAEAAAAPDAADAAADELLKPPAEPDGWPWPGGLTEDVLRRSYVAGELRRARKPGEKWPARADPFEDDGRLWVCVEKSDRTALVLPLMGVEKFKEAYPAYATKYQPALVPADAEALLQLYTGILVKVGRKEWVIAPAGEARTLLRPENDTIKGG